MIHFGLSGNRGSPDHLLSNNETTRRYSAFPEGPYTLYPDPYPLSLPNSGTTNPTEFSERRNVGQTYPTDPPERSRFRHSYTPSTPSVYPATLAAEEDVHFPADVEPSKPMQRQSAIAAPPEAPSFPPARKWQVRQLRPTHSAHNCFRLISFP